MGTKNNSNGFMLLFRGNDWYKALSQEQMLKVSSEWMAWFERLKQEGTCTAGSPLEQEGKVVSVTKGRVVVDGPFAESKETVGGYFLLRADDFEQAVAIAKGCPGLPYGAKVEVRPIAPECRLLAEAKEEAQLAGTSA